jgi:hypothetical protein
VAARIQSTIAGKIKLLSPPHGLSNVIYREVSSEPPGKIFARCDNSYKIPPLPMTLAEGTHLGRYEIRSKLGAGGMGEVYLAQDTQLRRPVALKRSN